MTDYLIVGHGLAGACLAAQLDMSGGSVQVIDKPENNVSSTKAAGLYNPITGRKMVKTWLADELFPYLERFYRSLERKFNVQFLHERSIYRPFLDIEEQNDWMGKSASEKFDDFVNQVHSSPKFAGLANDPFGGIDLKRSGFLDINGLLSASARYWSERDSYRSELFDFQQLHLGEKLQYKGQEYGTIVFCEGPAITANPYFSWLPVQPLKGEVLELTMERQFPMILNRGVFVFNAHQRTYKCGSTYNRNDQTLQPTEAARNEIETKLKDLICVEYNVMGQYAGLRPTVVDRRPIVGRHPEHRNMVVFNGLGTKGVSLAPLFAKQLSEYLHTGKEVAAEVHISRFLNKFID